MTNVTRNVVAGLLVLLIAAAAAWAFGWVQRVNAGQVLVCETIRSSGIDRRTATCPPEFIVTGCSAGGNRGSIEHEDGRCLTHDENTDWTQARCCKVEWVKP